MNYSEFLWVGKGPLKVWDDRGPCSEKQNTLGGVVPSSRTPPMAFPTILRGGGGGGGVMEPIGYKMN